MERLRKPYEGIWNIVRFNWHFYVFAVCVIVVLFMLTLFLPNGNFGFVWGIIAVFITLSLLTSLAVSHYVYDRSKLYTFNWLNGMFTKQPPIIANIHAGFDETSHLIAQKLSPSKMHVFDFYNPEKHTEVSIKRARKRSKPFAQTIAVQTNHLPLPDASVDLTLNVLSAHEIRDDEERIRFFKELKRALKTGGKIVVVEHLRDAVNFAAYNIGIFHFHSKQTWLHTFLQAGLHVEETKKITPFITVFILRKHEVAY